MGVKAERAKRLAMEARNIAEGGGHTLQQGQGLSIFFRWERTDKKDKVAEPFWRALSKKMFQLSFFSSFLLFSSFAFVSVQAGRESD